MKKIIHLIPYNGIGGVESAANTMKDIISNDFEFQLLYIFETQPKKKNYLNLGLRFKTNKEEKERDISHDMVLMKETSNLIILLRYMQKHTQENKMIIPEFKTDRRYER